MKNQLSRTAATVRDNLPVEVLPFLAAWTIVRGRLEGLREQDDRGDISITTVIIWFAAITGAVLIAGALTVLFTKYKNKIATF